MKQITIRGFDKELERALRRLARAEGLSLDQAAVRLLQQGAGLDPRRKADVVGDSLDSLIGTWSAREAREFSKSVRIFEAVDPEFWE